ncbi:MAG TPA: LL-diaminopimelate aminotransferase [Treponemataceae bacterium]|jgi:LL-diaminopimelate aminotransferase|nr:LL-diaminopimelate aminotransferase [Treponemataceae bacterium]
MLNRNPNIAHLSSGYLFPEISRRRNAYAKANPEARIISLGIGNTTEPLTPHVVEGLQAEALRLGTKEGYSGYGDETGIPSLRAKIAEVLYSGLVSPEEVFISDGAKCDIGRIQYLFGQDVAVAVQDPAYPVYVDGSVMIGAAGPVLENGSGYKGITYMPCTAENDFFPDLSVIPQNALVYFCSPNNPTGAVATKAQLEELVRVVRSRNSIIIFDSAYASFIRDPSLPKSIFEIDGARECAIEISSFSKPIGFTGVRLGWSIVPEQLVFSDGTPVMRDWTRLMTTIFNGASNIAQYGGLASLDEEGLAETRTLTDFYLENAALIRKALQGKNFTDAGVRLFGGDNAPYIWAQFPGRKSWEIFDLILDSCHVVCTPGAGFGPAGESFIRFSSFGHRDQVIEACSRLSSLVLN